MSDTKRSFIPFRHRTSYSGVHYCISTCPGVVGRHDTLVWKSGGPYIGQKTIESLSHAHREYACDSVADAFAVIRAWQIEDI